MGTVVQMYSGVAPADGMASIDVPHDGRLVGIDWAVNAAASAADFAIGIQLSFGSVSQLAVNDTRSVISSVVVGTDLTTSGAALTHVNKYVKLPDIQVGMGERIYIHAVGTAIVITVRACLHFDFELDRALTRRR